jgi:TolB-like protein
MIRPHCAEGSLVGFSDFVAELKRRRVIRALLGYGIFSFAVLQVIEPVLHAYDLSPWVLTAVVTTLAAGFPVAVILAWLFDLTADGVKRTPSVGGPVELALSRGRLAALLLGVGILAGLPGVAWYSWKGLAEHRAAATTPAAVPSIAVLPFADLSPNHDQDYFSDGVTEEILNALARVKGLKVVGRTSSFHFKGRNEDLKTIATTLGVAHILEGSVRKHGDRVRITAQLIQAKDGFDLWSQTYDGDLTDVFELQERIARAITKELKVVLGSEEKPRLVPVATSDPEAYALYLQATAILNQRDYPRMGEAIGWLEQALRLDPGFARGHARLAMIHALGRQKFGSSPDECVRHARMATELDPSLAEPWVALGLLAASQRRFVAARAALERALALDPDDAQVNLHDAQTLIEAGYTRQGIDRLDHALAIDPVLPTALYWRGHQYSFAGQQDAAERAFVRAATLGLSFADVGLAEVARARGDFAKARALLPVSWIYRAVCLDDPAVAMPIVLEGRFGGDVSARARARAVVERCLAASPERVPVWVLDHFLRFGEPARALELAASGLTDDEASFFMDLWGPLGLPGRCAPEFSEFARRTGLADLWERYGPPDTCRRVGSRDYICE